MTHAYISAIWELYEVRKFKAEIVDIRRKYFKNFGKYVQNFEGSGWNIVIRIYEKKLFMKNIDLLVQIWEWYFNFYYYTVVSNLLKKNLKISYGKYLFSKTNNPLAFTFNNCAEAFL